MRGRLGVGLWFVLVLEGRWGASGKVEANP